MKMDARIPAHINCVNHDHQSHVEEWLAHSPELEADKLPEEMYDAAEEWDFADPCSIQKLSEEILGGPKFTFTSRERDEAIARLTFANRVAGYFSDRATARQVLK
jgi:hypothetical protein